MQAKNAPTRFLGNQVIGYARIPAQKGEVPYQGVIICVHTEEGRDVFTVHSIGCRTLDAGAPWYGISGWYDLTYDRAWMKFGDYIRFDI